MSTKDIYENPASQEVVDEYTEEVERLSADIDCEDTAVEILRLTNYLRRVSDEYFVPENIKEHEKEALKHIENPKTYFTRVFYEIFEKEHKNFFESIEVLEKSVMEEKIIEDEIFELVREFNISMDETNRTCERYEAKPFEKYRFKSQSLQKRYDEWIKS